MVANNVRIDFSNLHHYTIGIRDKRIRHFVSCRNIHYYTIKRRVLVHCLIYKYVALSSPFSQFRRDRKYRLHRMYQQNYNLMDNLVQHLGLYHLQKKCMIQQYLRFVLLEQHDYQILNLVGYSYTNRRKTNHRRLFVM